MITGAFGLGEPVVKGSVNPDEWRVFTPLLASPGHTPILDAQSGLKQIKMVLDAQGTPQVVETTPEERRRRCLDEAEVLPLARWCARIAEHNGRPNGYRMGQGWQHGRDVHRAGSAGNSSCA